MPDDIKKSVNDEASLASKQPDPASSERNQNVDRTLEDVIAENKRKATELKELRKEIEDIKAQSEERLEEIYAKGNRITPSEQQEASLIEQSIAAIEADAKAKPWLELNKRQADKRIKEYLDTQDLENAMDMIDDLAEKESIERSDLEKALRPYIRMHQGERPTRKVRLAYKDYLKQKGIEEKLAKYEKGETIPRESDTRPSRQEGNAKEAYAEAKKSGDYAQVLKGLANWQEMQSSR